MKNYFFFILTFLCLYFIGFEKTAFAQTNSKNILEQPVTVVAQNETLENILSDLSKKYNVRFSYSNSRLPLQRKITLNVSNIPLRKVLRQIFEPLNDENTQIQFRLINGQIVIQAKSNLAETNTEELEKNKKPQIASLPKNPLIIDKKDKTSKTASVSTKKNEINDKNDVELIEKNTVLDSLTNLGQNEIELSKIDSLKNLENQLLDSTKTDKTDSLSFQENKNSKFAKTDSLVEAFLDSAALQITLIYPLGTNGAKSPYKNNRFSLNILAGYNGSVTGFEVGGFANILKKDIKGFQIAGFSNIVGGKTTGFQGSGFANITKDSVEAFQAAGFMNMNGNATKGFQGAGFMNVVNGDFAGFQAAGSTNIVNGNVQGIQITGFMNVAKENVDGAQISGFLNIAKDVKGIQIGIINRADTVKGSQIGIINIADSVTGVPIGLINFVQNGYRSFDVSASEGFHTTLSYNIGVDKFYQIVSAGIQMSDKMRWGIGGGLGTRFPITKSQKTHAGFELMAYHLNEENWTNKLNLLGQLKFKIHHQISRQVGIFIAPTLNVTVSQIYNAETNTYGTNFAPYSFIEDTSSTTNSYNNNTTNTKIWGGGFIGISF
ncbi:DUF4974 domain-containing protein [Bernardetia sp. OM2101]|uniref:DUF4974 domain-containing protein n=1 Tax=Bernardetia sp. OM2101 TaxID=3344876 RepID=UPI0035CFDEFF